MQFIEEAGMLDAVLAGGFQFKNGAAFVRDGEYSDYNFSQKTAAGYSYTFQVPRADFDKVLADEAARQGAEIRYEGKSTRWIFPARRRRSRRAILPVSSRSIGHGSCSMPAVSDARSRGS